MISMLAAYNSRIMIWEDPEALLGSVLERADGTSWEWMDEFILGVVRLNPSPAVQTVVKEDPTRSRDFFRVSFSAVWTNTSGTDFKDAIVFAFECMLSDPRSQTGIVEAVIGLIEYMDLQETPIPIRMPIVAVAAERHELYTKALYFREQEYRESRGLPSSECVEALIAINIKLGNLDSVQGLLKSSASNFVKVRASWYEKLENWPAALSSYTVRLLEDKSNNEWLSGRMRCLSALGEWDKLLQVSTTSQSSSSALFEAEACFNLQRWDDLKRCLILNKEKLEGHYETCVYEAVSAIRSNDLESARSWLERARIVLGSPRPGSNRRSMIRALNHLQLTQLDEIVEFVSTTSPSVASTKIAALKAKWNQRLLDLEYSLDVWKRLVPIRAIIFSPTGDDVDMWVRYSTLSRKKQNLTLSKRIVERLQQGGRSEFHGVILSKIKNDYAEGSIEAAINGLEKFLHDPVLNSQCTPYLLAKCFLALGLWLPSTDPRVAEYVSRSMSLDPKGYKAQSTQALIKFREAQTQGFGPHVVDAVKSLFTAILLASRVQLPDVLRLLTLFFSFYGQDATTDETFDEGFLEVPLQTWVHAIPQILARLRSRRTRLRECVHRLVLRIGEQYPQSVVFALTVAASSSGPESSDLLALHAKQILENISQWHPNLVSECALVARELVRISSSWTEQCAALLEDASRMFFVEKDLGGMLRKLTQIHSKLFDVSSGESKASTPSEMEFIRKHGEDLERAFLWVRKYVETHEVFYLDQAWGIYYQTFQKLHQQVTGGKMKQVSLAHVSPELNKLHDTCLLVPTLSDTGGTYIHSFLSSIEIVSSKQRPRVIKMLGSNGRTYRYLLKANEDLKQDERVMQLFSLVNTVISDSVASRRRSGVFPTTPGIETLEDVQLKRFAVVPLSQNAGLIEWVEDCDTLYALIKARREKLGIPLSLEHNLMRHMGSAHYEDLPLLNRVEVFEFARSQTSGNELRDSMWLSSGGSETWLRRRSMYSRSLAVTSIVGYILGLGDRHPSNLMIEQGTGQVIHIDFGDCFDVAATRERYPEKIPFRLTRQLVNSLEVSGVDGTFRITAERMMDLVRKNSDSIMAMLEAFIYDPLITWRLMPDGRDAESLSNRAKSVVERVHAKLAGEEPVAAHVDRLIREATAPENLCQCYVGWCPFW
jgi:FKBP12-rapamycin complex-associated protein